MRFDMDSYRLQKQKMLAQCILDTLLDIDLQAVLAGGAPRDWLILQKPAKDLDIFYKIPSGISHPDEITALLRQKFNFIENVTLPDKLKEKYQNFDPSIFCVHDCKIDNEDIQFVGCVSAVESRHESFNLNISQIKWTPLSGFIFTKEFSDCHYGHKEIKEMCAGFNLVNDYISKMNLKFKPYGYKPLLFTDSLETNSKERK